MARLIEHHLGGMRLLGYSVAGEESVVAAPELNVCFDVGNCPAEILPIDHVLLSHGHMDHAAGLAYYFSQRNFVGNAPGTVLLPTPLLAPVRDLLKVWGRIEGHESPGRIIGMAPGEEFVIRRGLVVRTFEVNHGGAALGFAIVDIRHKLKPEFSDKTGPELVELKKKGITIQQTLEVPLVAYCGDTAEGRWIESDLVQKAQVLIVECTFYDAEHVTRAREGRHLHVRDMARLLRRLSNPHVLLTHVTRRTGTREAKRILSQLTDEETMKRVQFLMDGRRHRPGAATQPELPKPG